MILAEAEYLKFSQPSQLQPMPSATSLQSPVGDDDEEESGQGVQDNVKI